MTPELETTFKLLEMRPYLYKDKHYKKSMKWKQPTYFGVGTVMDDAKDYYSTRVKKRDRKQNLGEEFLSDPSLLSHVDKKMSEMKEKKRKQDLMRRKKSNPKKRAPTKFRVKRK